MGVGLFYTNVYTDVDLHERVNFTSSKFLIFANPRETDVRAIFHVTKFLKLWRRNSYFGRNKLRRQKNFSPASSPSLGFIVRTKRCLIKMVERISFLHKSLRLVPGR